jgi:hypothetical protein
MIVVLGARLDLHEKVTKSEMADLWRHFLEVVGGESLSGWWKSSV